MKRVFGHSELLRGVGDVHDEVRRLVVLLGALELDQQVAVVFHIFINFTLKYL